MNSENHGKLPFDVCENFSDSEFDSNDINKDVEFTISIVSVRTADKTQDSDIFCPDTFVLFFRRKASSEQYDYRG